MRQQIIANAACLLVALASLIIAAWTVITGQIAKQGIDALFLILVCLLFAFAFSLMPLQALRGGLLNDLLKGKKNEDAPPAEKS